MARKRKKELSMSIIREVLRMGIDCKISNRQIAKTLHVSHSTVGEYLKQAQAKKLMPEKIRSLSDLELENLVRPQTPGGTQAVMPKPDWEYIRRELSRKGVTLQLLWHEYKEVHPRGYQFSHFCELYRRWNKNLGLSMRQTHKAGDKTFIDYAGQTVPIHDPLTGEVKEASIFVASLGLSQYTYAEAAWDQSLPSWTMSHVRAFEYFEGVTRSLIVDNLRSGVSKACRYEPDLNPTYRDLAVHYQTTVLPARIRRPKDKSKVENAVGLVSRWILASLRNHKFFSLEELNDAIGQRLEILNNKPFKKLKGSRRDWFLALEKDVLIPLPKTRFVYAEWKRAKVNIDYHVDLNNHYYSVPYAFRGQTVDIRYTGATVEVFCRSQRIASHVRDHRERRHTTVKEHMPKSHQDYLEWTPSRMVRWAAELGPHVKILVERILQSRAHPEQGYRSCLGIIRLGKRFGNDRLEKAAYRAVGIGAINYKSVRSILDLGLDQKIPAPIKPSKPITHQNVRGPGYYNNAKGVHYVNSKRFCMDRPENSSIKRN